MGAVGARQEEGCGPPAAPGGAGFFREAELASLGASLVQTLTLHPSPTWKGPAPLLPLTSGPQGCITPAGT